MDPVELPFEGLGKFVDLMPRFPSIAWIFRGQACHSWELRPKAGRPEYFLPRSDEWVSGGHPPRDLCRFNAWRRQAVAFCPNLPENDFECLAYAQHYGLATRLLDWTTNPLVALFFAVEAKPEVNGAVYCYFLDPGIDAEVMAPGEIHHVARYRPRPFDRRILAQSGLFTCHPQPHESLQAGALDVAKVRELAKVDVNLVKITIPAEWKGLVQGNLSVLGVARSTLFPDLEGLSSFINWETRRILER